MRNWCWNAVVYSGIILGSDFDQLLSMVAVCSKSTILCLVGIVVVRL